MTSKERYNLLVDWKKQYDLCYKAQELLDQLFDNVGSTLDNAIWITFEKYTDALSALVGDNGEWLDWFCWENDMGDSCSSAKASSWKKMRKISTLKDLCKIIEADLA